MTAPAQDKLNELTYETRFGTVALREDRLLTFEKGLFGFSECTTFGLTRLPNADESPLLLLQCVNEPQVSFLVADPSMLGLDIKEADKQTALQETQQPEDDTQFLAILTMYDNDDSYYVTANLRAPLMINSNARTGVQHILASKDYTTQHKI